MFSFFKKPEEEITAVFDIGNGSIGGALVKLSRHDHPVILYSHREPITFTAHPAPKHLLSSMLKLLKVVADRLAKDGLSHIKTTPFGSHKLRDAHCVFAAPWYISQTKVIKLEHDRQFTVTKETMNELVRKEQEEFNQAIKEGKYQQIFGPDTRLLEKRIINVQLNGYDIEEPLGKKAKELALTLFSSFISGDILVGVENTLHKSFAVRNIHHYSYALVSWYGTRIIYPDLHNFFFVDISGETTDISLVTKDLLVETISFPMGRSTLLRKIVRDFKVPPEVALSYVTMKYNRSLEKSLSEKLDAAVKPLEEDWHDQFALALEHFKKSHTLPRSTIVTADSDTAGFFMESLKSTMPVELNLPHDTLAVTFVGADKTQQLLYYLDNIQHDAFIGIESVFLNSIFNHNN